MSKSGTASALSLGQYAELVAAVVRQLPQNIDPSVAQGWIENQEALQNVLRGALMSPLSIQEQMESWISFYKELFGIELQIEDLVIPERKSGFTRLLVIAQGLTLEQSWKVCQDLFPCYKDYEISEQEVPTNDRNAKDGTYAIWLRDRVEADKELKSTSADQLAERGVSVITLLERLILELIYFRETGSHLDNNNWTLCAGSRGRDGSVPSMCWYDGRLSVSWDHAGLAAPLLRAREVVSLAT